jgi:predicted N-formylglutamate amidohydrolase
MPPITANLGGHAPLLLTCEHATNHIPAALNDLDLSKEQLSQHVAWDPGALLVARVVAAELDAPLIAAPASRLLIDPNRDVEAPDLIPRHAEHQPIAANEAISADELGARLKAYYDPFHAAIDDLLSARADIWAIVSIHSFTPILYGKRRPWHVGVLHDPDCRLADSILRALEALPDLVAGRNRPYSPKDGVYFSMRRHGSGRATAMLEIRNDLIQNSDGQKSWAKIVAEAIKAGLQAGAGEP